MHFLKSCCQSNLMYQFLTKIYPTVLFIKYTQIKYYTKSTQSKTREIFKYSLNNKPNKKKNHKEIGSSVAEIFPVQTSFEFHVWNQKTLFRGNHVWNFEASTARLRTDLQESLNILYVFDVLKMASREHLFNARHSPQMQEQKNHLLKPRNSHVSLKKFPWLAFLKYGTINVKNWLRFKILCAELNTMQSIEISISVWKGRK